MAGSLPEPAKWGLDPTFWSSMKLSNSEILSLKEHEEYDECFLLGNRVVAKVQILGDIVSVHEREKNVHFCVDDGSAVVRCVLWKNRDDWEWDAAANGLTLGAVVHVQGKIKVFRGERQLSVMSWRVEDDVHALCLHWLDTVQLHREVYQQAATYTVVDVQASTTSQTTTLTGKLSSGFAGVLEEYFTREKQLAQGSFSFSDIQEVETLKDEARSKLGYSGSLSEEQAQRVKRLFSSSIRQLVCKGVLHHADIANDVYCVVNVEKHIVPVVRALLSNACRHGNKHVSERRIGELVREQPNWSYATTEQVREAIRLCTHYGFIYEVEPGNYRPV